MTDLQARLVWIGRSDGVVERNEPEQLDRTKYPDSYYELLDDGHATALEWKRQLGSLLQKAHQGENTPGPKWFLGSFPENYRLYKPVKPKQSATPAEPGAAKKVKNEAYLYGYPLGDKKKYRSAQEFFPHLLWLSNDGSEEYEDCSCKMCSPEWIQKLDPPMTQPVPTGPVRPASGSQKEPKAKIAIPARKPEVMPVRTDKAVAIPKVVIPARTTGASGDVVKATAPPMNATQSTSQRSAPR